jgi:hypothetical protein
MKVFSSGSSKHNAAMAAAARLAAKALRIAQQLASVNRKPALLDGLRDASARRRVMTFGPFESFAGPERRPVKAGARSDRCEGMMTKVSYVETI